MVTTYPAAEVFRKCVLLHAGGAQRSILGHYQFHFHTDGEHCTLGHPNAHNPPRGAVRTRRCYTFSTNCSLDRDNGRSSGADTPHVKERPQNTNGVGFAAAASAWRSCADDGGLCCVGTDECASGCVYRGESRAGEYCDGHDLPPCVGSLLGASRQDASLRHAHICISLCQLAAAVR